MSLDQNLGTHLQAVDLLPMASVNADGNGTGVDMQQFVGSVAVVLSAKATAGTSPTMDIKLQSSADNSTGWADISGAAFTQVTDANTSAAIIEKISVNVDACERYVRAVKDIGGTSSPAFMISCHALGVKQVR